MSWNLRYAPHMGLASLEEPLFLHSVGSADPVEQLRHIAALGFAGVEDNYLKLRPVADQERIGREIGRLGLEMGCFTGNIENWNQPLWGSSDDAARDRLKSDLLASIDIADRVGGRFVTTVSGQDGRIPLAYQLANMVENLKRLAPIAERAGIVLAIESTNERRFPGQLVHHIADAYAVAQAVDSPAVQLVFDIAHVHPMDGEILVNLEITWDRIGIIQVADMPGRLELGTGELNWVNIFRFIRDRGYRGLIELEHENSEPGAAGEQAMLERLRAIDSAI
jgi:hydroxypyruvate isomerase